MRGYAHVLEAVTIDDIPALIKRERRDAHRVDLRTWEEAAILQQLHDQGFPVSRVLGLGAIDGAFLMERVPGVVVESHWPRGTPLPRGAVTEIASILTRLACVSLTCLPALPPSRPTGQDTPGFFKLLLEHTSTLMSRYCSEHAERLGAIEIHGTAFASIQTAGERVRSRALRLCHGDLNRSNLLLDDDRIRIVDWELATLGDPAWDVAVLIHRAGLTAEDVRELLARLQATHPEPPDDESVAAYVALERFRSLLIDTVRYRERGHQSSDREREYLTRRFTAKLREARPHLVWSTDDVARFLFER